MGTVPGPEWCFYIAVSGGKVWEPVTPKTLGLLQESRRNLTGSDLIIGGHFTLMQAGL